MNAPLQKTIKTSTGKELTVYIIKGDIATVPADAMITAINSGGAWFGGIDGVISKHCGEQYHDQAADAMPLQDKQTVVAKKKNPTSAAFKDVIFVVDNLKGPLNQVVQAGLATANENGYKTVTLPAIRTGVFIGWYEKTVQDAVIQLLRGIDQHIDNFPNTQIQSIGFVIYSDGPVMDEMEKAVKLWNAA